MDTCKSTKKLATFSGHQNKGASRPSIPQIRPSQRGLLANSTLEPQAIESLFCIQFWEIFQQHLSLPSKPSSQNVKNKSHHLKRKIGCADFHHFCLSLKFWGTSEFPTFLTDVPSLCPSFSTDVPSFCPSIFPHVPMNSYHFTTFSHEFPIHFPPSIPSSASSRPPSRAASCRSFRTTAPCYASCGRTSSRARSWRRSLWPNWIVGLTRLMMVEEGWVLVIWWYWYFYRNYWYTYDGLMTVILWYSSSDIFWVI